MSTDGHFSFDKRTLRRAKTLTTTRIKESKAHQAQYSPRTWNFKVKRLNNKKVQVEEEKKTLDLETRKLEKERREFKREKNKWQKRVEDTKARLKKLETKLQNKENRLVNESKATEARLGRQADNLLEERNSFKKKKVAMQEDEVRLQKKRLATLKALRSESDNNRSSNRSTFETKLTELRKLRNEKKELKRRVVFLEKQLKGAENRKERLDRMKEELEKEREKNNKMSLEFGKFKSEYIDTVQEQTSALRCLADSLEEERQTLLLEREGREMNLLELEDRHQNVIFATEEEDCDELETEIEVQIEEILEEQFNSYMIEKEFFKEFSSEVDHEMGRQKSMYELKKLDLQLKIDESRVFRKVLSGCFDEIANELALQYDEDDDGGENLYPGNETPVIRSLVQMHYSEPLPFKDDDFFYPFEDDDESATTSKTHTTTIICAPVNFSFGDQMMQSQTDISTDMVSEDMKPITNTTNFSEFEENATIENAWDDLLLISSHEDNDDMSISITETHGEIIQYRSEEEDSMKTPPVLSLNFVVTDESQHCVVDATGSKFENLSETDITITPLQHKPSPSMQSFQNDETSDNNTFICLKDGEEDELPLHGLIVTEGERQALIDMRHELELERLEYENAMRELEAEREFVENEKIKLKEKRLTLEDEDRILMEQKKKLWLEVDEEVGKVNNKKKKMKSLVKSMRKYYNENSNEISPELEKESGLADLNTFLDYCECLK